MLFIIINKLPWTVTGKILFFLVRKSWIVFFITILTLGYIQANQLYKNHEVPISIIRSSGYSGAHNIFVYGNVIRVNEKGKNLGNFDTRPLFKISYANHYSYALPDKEGNLKAELFSLENFDLKPGINFVTIEPVNNFMQSKNGQYQFIKGDGTHTTSLHLPFFHTTTGQNTIFIVEVDTLFMRPKVLHLSTSIIENNTSLTPRKDVIEVIQKIGQSQYTIFYLSNHPQSSYQALEQFIKQNHLPSGPLLLRNIGFPIITTGDGSIYRYTKECIQEIATILENKKIVLIGSNLLRDEAVFSKLYRKFPQNISEIYILEFKKNKHRQYNNLHYISHTSDLTDFLVKVYSRKV